MAEYIKREDAITDAFCGGVSCQECPFLIHPVHGGCKIEDYIKSIPAADVIERKRGKWLYTPTHWAYCSECGKEPPDECNIASDFCPNCGADMREESWTQIVCKCGGKRFIVQGDVVVCDKCGARIESEGEDMDSFIRIFEGDDEEDGMDSFIRILKD